MTTQTPPSSDGRKILNIGCGSKTSNHPDVTNIDWSVYLSIKKNPLVSTLLFSFISKQRQDRLRSLPDAILVHDLRKGLPFANDSVDMVYHSHFFEHLDRTHAASFLKEVYRVLKPGGVHRIVVPDMEWLCRQYLEHINLCDKDAAEIRQHDDYVFEIVEQMVRKESYGSSQQKPAVRWLENTLLGDARKRGETHQWMYDRINLGYLLEQIGYIGTTVRQFNTSHLADWNQIGLDQNTAGGEYKPGSLYIEAFK